MRFSSAVELDYVQWSLNFSRIIQKLLRKLSTSGMNLVETDRMLACRTQTDTHNRYDLTALAVRSAVKFKTY